MARLAKGSNGSRCGAFTEGKGWRRSIGFKAGKNGRLIPARWWLGLDEQSATVKALQIESLWVGLDSPYWTREALAIAEGIRTGGTRKDSPALSVGRLDGETNGQPNVVVLDGLDTSDRTGTATALEAFGSIANLSKQKTILTVNGLIERFRTAYNGDARLTRASKHSMACRTKSLERSPIANLPLASVGVEQIATTVSYWLQRPTNGKGEQISEYSARMIVKTARTVFDWADSCGLWAAPRRFDRLFRLPRKVNPPAFEVFSVQQLAKLYRAASDDMKLIILLSLNCGFCSSELASLRKDEIDLKAKRIKRARQKTQVVMEWALWNETVKALQKGMAKDGELAITTGGGKPLVWYSDEGHRVDVLPNRWDRLLKSANDAKEAKDNKTGIRKPKQAKEIAGSFKLLRKTGATMIRAIAGIEVSEMYLAHSEKSMAKFYSTPSQDRLTKALAILRRQLGGMFKK